MNVLCNCLHHYKIVLIPWLWMNIHNHVSLSIPLQYIVDPVNMNVLYHCIHHCNILLIPYLWMSCITFYAIKIYYWFSDYECPVSLYTSLQYIIDPMFMNVLCHFLHHYNILWIPCIWMSCVTFYTTTIYCWSHDY